MCELYSIFRNYIALNAPEHTPDDPADLVDPAALLKHFDSDEERIMFQMALEVLDRLERYFFVQNNLMMMMIASKAV
ncbi:unnamed protein product [Dibothriocephalus latus]|uniref:Uncharacterized protein n=1 Tax=Dibothriocephalus latus TaxID=60516 RepID=A0A3P7NTV2_DIBLA|nr:unnamed protein product [Dibothriocephalus latus]